MRLTYFGSGAFGLPTFAALAARHEVVLVVSQPDRPAGRRRRSTSTPISAAAGSAGLPLLRPERPDDPEVLAALDAAAPDALVVIAYGHRLPPAVIGDRFAINLHASLLPAWRGAAPINRAMMHGDTETGVSVIALAQTIDAGRVLASRRTPIDPRETAGELHDRLAALGPALVLEVLDAHAAGALEAVEQDPARVSRAPKLSRADAQVDFAAPAAAVRAHIHGLTPWPGVTIEIDGRPLRVGRVEELPAAPGDPPAGVLEGDRIGCAPGTIRLLEVQSPGKRMMSFAEWARGAGEAGGRRAVTCRGGPETVS